MSEDNPEKTAAGDIDEDEQDDVLISFVPLVGAAETKGPIPTGIAEGLPNTFAVTVSSGHFAKSSAKQIEELCETRLNRGAVVRHKREDMAARSIQRAFKKWRDAKRRRDSKRIV